MKKQTNLKTLLMATALALTVIIALPAPTIAQQQPNKVFEYVEQMPKYKGGDGKELKDFLINNITYPADARAHGLEGLVVVTFVIDETGKVNNAKVVKGLGRGTDEEALRVANLTSGHWTPGQQNGKVVQVRYALPIRFALTEAERATTADVANQMPRFNGGQEALHSTIANYVQLPAEAKQENLDARIVARFYVAEDGTVSNIRLEETKLKKTIGAGADMDYMDASTFQVQNKAVLAKLAEAATAAIRATSGNWYPALKDGQPREAEVVLPLYFTGSNTRNATTMGTPEMTKYTQANYKYEDADVKPMFKDGSAEKFLAKNLKYPANSTFEGTIETGITIKEDGSVFGPFIYFDPKNPDREKRIGKELYMEINRVFKLMEGKWQPAKVDGKAVTVTRKFVIQFGKESDAQKAEPTGVKPDVIIKKFN